MNVERIAAERAVATEAWLSQIDDPDPGWSLLQIDLEPVVAAFDLKLHRDYRLIIVSEQWGRDGEGHPSAVPSNAASSVIGRLADTLASWEHESPPEVPEAATDVGAALQAATTEDHHLAASLAVREIHEIGARGHGLQWLDERVIGDQDAGDLLLEEGWDWRGPVPTSLDPGVVLARSGAIVVFYTYSEIGGRRLRRHEDRYDGASLTATRRSDLLASSPGGFVR